MPKLSEEYNLKVLYPHLVEEWHYEKNGDLKPENFTPFNGTRVWWKCSNGHEWETPIQIRSKGSGCPYCYGRYPSKENNLAVKIPHLAAQWHPTKNGEVTPDKVSPKANFYAWWMCERGHEWQSSVCHRSRFGCPVCALDINHKKRKLEKLSEALPELAAQWHPTLNGEFTPDQISPGSKIKVWWQCSFGHSWPAAIKKRAKGTGCPYCSGRLPSKENNLAVVYPELAKQWHPTKNGKLTPRKVTPSAHAKVWWLCPNGHEWDATVISRSNGNGCGYCSGKRRKPKPEE
jgi:hypothetical protein